MRSSSFAKTVTLYEKPTCCAICSRISCRFPGIWELLSCLCSVPAWAYFPSKRKQKARMLLSQYLHANTIGRWLDIALISMAGMMLQSALLPHHAQAAIFCFSGHAVGPDGDEILILVNCDLDIARPQVPAGDVQQLQKHFSKSLLVLSYGAKGTCCYHWSCLARHACMELGKTTTYCRVQVL